jgi:putative transposase
LCTGCPWAWLPHDYPPKGTVYDYFQKWRKDGSTELVLQKTKNKWQD